MKQGIAFDGERLVVPDDSPRCLFDLPCNHAGAGYYCRKAKTNALLLRDCPLRRWVTLTHDPEFDRSILEMKRRKRCEGCCSLGHSGPFRIHEASGLPICEICHPAAG